MATAWQRYYSAAPVLKDGERVIRELAAYRSDALLQLFARALTRASARTSSKLEAPDGGGFVWQDGD